jgi:hypothetical protein
MMMIAAVWRVITTFIQPAFRRAVNAEAVHNLCVNSG